MTQLHVTFPADATQPTKQFGLMLGVQAAVFMSVPTPSLAAHFVKFDRDSECTQVTCLASIPHATSVPYPASCMLACLLRKHANLLCV